MPSKQGSREECWMEQTKPKLNDQEHQEQVEEAQVVARDDENTAKDLDRDRTSHSNTPRAHYPLMPTLRNCIQCFRRDWPRTFHFLIRVVIPLLGLIGVSFFCGLFLARLEAPNEMSSNDASLAVTFNESLLDSSIAYGTYVPDACLADWNVTIPTFNETGLRNFLRDCREELVSNKREGESQEDVTFDWILCGERETPYADQYDHVIVAWTQDFFRLMKLYAITLNMTFWEANDLALEEATGHQDCTVHTAAGALFWMTIMTTIGWGNTSPSTTGGRTLVYTLGFLSIILFGYVIGCAGHICIVVFDDFCLRRKLKWLVQGFVAPLFWLSVLALWLLVLAGMAINYDRVVGVSQKSLADAYWFMYISITTVGLGDIFLAPETALAIDVFIVSIVFLIGFVLMANFLLKLADWLGSIISIDDSQPLEEVLKERRNAEEDSASQPHESVDDAT